MTGGLLGRKHRTQENTHHDERQARSAYLRLSAAKDDSVSVAGQTTLVKHEAQRRGWPEPILFVDDGVSGSKAYGPVESNALVRATTRPLWMVRTGHFPGSGTATAAPPRGAQAVS